MTDYPLAIVKQSGGDVCCAMAMQSRGILELMDAEKEADKLVKDARKSKCGMNGELLGRLEPCNTEGLRGTALKSD